MVFVLLALFLIPMDAAAWEFDANVAPGGRWLMKFYPKIYYTSAYFSDEGKSLNLDSVTGLLYMELPPHLQYGITDKLSVGAIVPLGWTYQEVKPEIREDPISRWALREIRLTVQHRWIAFGLISSSSVRIKIPLMDKKDWEDGLGVGDGQVDIYPAYYFDYFNKKYSLYTETGIGYKYRLKSGDVKPFDEWNFRCVLGRELMPVGQIRFFLYTDLTAFRNGDYGEIDGKFFQQEGSLHTFGYGVSLWPRPTMRLEIVTGGDWSGRNRYRGMRWMIGIAQII